MATRKKKSDSKRSKYDSDYDAANVVNAPPVDVWGRPIEDGTFVLSDTGTGAVYRAGNITVYGDRGSPAGFGLARPTHPDRLDAAGTHVNWEVVARPGQKPPDKDKIRRDSEGAPILGPSNGLPRQLPETACRVH